MQQDFKARLRALRQAKGLTQRELADMTGLTNQSIHHYEAGKRTPSITVAARLADALDVTVNDLIVDPVDALVDRLVARAPELNDEQIATIGRALFPAAV